MKTYAKLKAEYIAQTRAEWESVQAGVVNLILCACILAYLILTSPLILVAWLRRLLGGKYD